MVNINLVPEKLRSAETLKIIVLLGSLSLALPVAFWAMRFQAKRAELATVERELEALNLQLASPALKDVVAAVEQFAKDQSDLDSKRSIVDKLRSRQVLILKFLDSLPDVIPGTARIKGLTITDAKGLKTVDMKVECVALEAVASAYESLEASPLVDKLEMVSGPESLPDASGVMRISTELKFNLVEQP